MVVARSVSMGLIGDTTVNLLWRLENGEGPDGLKAKVVVVLIGTNDLVQQADVRLPALPVYCSAEDLCKCMQ